MTAKEVRVFVAIDFNSTTKDRIFDIQSKLKETASKGRFIPKQNFHLTLVFIGKTTNDRIGDIKQTMKRIKFQSFDIIFDTIGRFDRGRKNVYWLGVRENKELQRVHLDLFNSLITNGFELQKKKFTPHITLARDLIKEKDEKILFQPFSYKVNSVSLMQTIMGQKTLYKELYRIEIPMN